MCFLDVIGQLFNYSTLNLKKKSAITRGYTQAYDEISNQKDLLKRKWLQGDTSDLSVRH